jgi:tyrosine-protein kinase Etk/Wzc
MNPTKENLTSPREEPVNILAEITRQYLPFWPVFVLTISISIFLGHVHLRYQTPLYMANASIMLKDKESGMETVINALEGTQEKQNVENQIEILKSRNIMSEVVIQRGLYSQIYVPGRVKHVLLYESCPVTFVALNPQEIKSSPGLVSFTFMPREKVVLLDGKKYPVDSAVNLPYGKFQINVDPLMGIQKNAQYFLQIKKVNDVAKDLLGNLGVYTGAKQSTLLNLSFTDPVPKRAEDILNTLIEVFNKTGIDEKNTAAKNTLDFIDDRLKKLTVALGEVESEVERYKREGGITNMSTKGNQLIQSVEGIDRQMAEVNIQLSVLQNIESYVMNSDAETGTVPSTFGINDPTLLKILSELNAAEANLARLRKTVAENSPAIIAAKNQIAQIKPNLLENIRNLKQNLLTTLQELRNESYKYTAEISDLPTKEKELAVITREQTVKNNIYTFLLEKREETAISYAASAPDSRVVNPAESTGYPVKPTKSNIYFFALLAGIMAGVLFVLLREKLISEVAFRSEVEKATHATILAEILHDGGKKAVVVTDGNRTPIAEQFRSLRTSLSYLGINRERNTVLFTSSISGEGKSFTAINLGATLALTNKKVVLLELDLRKPKVSSMLNIVNEPGITNYLAGLATINEIIKPVDEVNNLFVIPAGSIPPNPTELILNGKLDILMEQLKRDFDYVLMDSPPIGLVTDAKLLNKYSDLCLYIVRHKRTPKSYLKYINNLYLSKELNNMNIVFNGLKPRGLFGFRSSYGSGYGYGDGYGYGYTHEAQKKKPFWKRKSKKKRNKK